MLVEFAANITVMRHTSCCMRVPLPGYPVVALFLVLGGFMLIAPTRGRFFHWPLSSLHLARPAFGMLVAAIGCRTSHSAACLRAATIDEQKRAISTCTLGPLRANTAEPDRAPRNLLANTACSSATSLPKPLKTSCFKRFCCKSKGARTAPRGPRLRTSLSFKLCPPAVGRGCICCGGSGRASACWSQGAPE